MFATRQGGKMHKKIWIILIVLGIMLMCVLFYYFRAFNELNNLMKFANNGVEMDFEGDDTISKEDFLSLQVITPEENGGYYINGGVSYGIKSIGLDTISFVCSCEYTKHSAATTEVIQYAKQSNLIVEMKFEGFQWKVVSVQKG